jgi:DNA mismatch repair ATPase MutL
VANDADKQRLFLRGLHDGLQLQLMSNAYPDYQTLVNRAIVVDNKRKEMDAKRKRLQGQVYGNNARQRTGFQQGYQQRYPPNQWNRGQLPSRNQFLQRPPYQLQNGNNRPPQQNGNQNQCQSTPNNTPTKTSAPNNPTKCFRCGKEGHLSYNYPEKVNQQTPKKQNSNQKVPYYEKVTHVSEDTAMVEHEVMLGTFDVHSIPATVLFDYGASHSFIS